MGIKPRIYELCKDESKGWECPSERRKNTPSEKLMGVNTGKHFFKGLWKLSLQMKCAYVVTQTFSLRSLSWGDNHIYYQKYIFKDVSWLVVYRIKKGNYVSSINSMMFVSIKSRTLTCLKDYYHEIYTEGHSSSWRQTQEVSHRGSLCT